MGAEHQLGTAFRAATRRLGAAATGRIAKFWDTILPVQVVGRSFSNTSQPLFGLRAFGGGQTGNLVSVSWSSALDFEIQQISANILNLGAPATTPIAIVPMAFLTPASSYLPFATAPIFTDGGAPAIGPVLFEAQVRPTETFSAGSTFAIVGGNPVAPPTYGPRLDQLYRNATEFQTGPPTVYYYFDPPLVIPQFTFLTLQATNVQQAAPGQWGIDTSIWYRELPT